MTQTDEDTTPLYFLHIAKTGGVTLSCFLQAGFRQDAVCPAENWASLLQLSPQHLEGYRLFRGHFGAMLLDVLPRRPAIITMLRDPVDRTASHWLYIRRHRGHPRHSEVRRQGRDFATFVRSCVANPQARNLAVDAAPRDLVRRFGADASLPPAEAQRMFDLSTVGQPNLLDGAVARLEESLAFGVLDRFDESLRLIAHSLGWAPPIGMPQLNSVPENEHRYEPSPEEAELVREWNAVDVALIERARVMFDRRWDAARRHGPENTYAGRLATRSRPLTEPLVVDMGEPFAGTGWLPASRTESGWTRWMGHAGPATIDLPVLLPRFSRVEILCPAAASPELLTTWKLEINGMPVTLTARPHDAGVLFSGVVPGEAGDSGFTRMTVRAPRTVAVDVGIPIYDTFHAGIAISWVRLVPCVTIRPNDESRLSAPASTPTPCAQLGSSLIDR